MISKRHDRSRMNGAIADIFHRLGTAMAATKAIGDMLLSARAIASDETSTRINGITQWQWMFISDKAVLHKIAPRRTRRVAGRCWVITSPTSGSRIAMPHADGKNGSVPFLPFTVRRGSPLGRPVARRPSSRLPIDDDRAIDRSAARRLASPARAYRSLIRLDQPLRLHEIIPSCRIGQPQ